MHRPKSKRHARAANARWRAAEARAQAEREAGIPDVPLPVDVRDPFTLDLRNVGGKVWRFEPRVGYIAWRRIGEGGEVECAALKTLLHRTADELPRAMSLRRCM